MKLSTILIFSFILVGIFGSLFGTYSYYVQSSNLLEERAIDHLESVAQSTENFIEEILEEQKEKIEIAATHMSLTLDELNDIINRQEEFFEIFVLDENGFVNLSSDQSQEGKDKSQDAYFINARQRTYFKPAYLSETTNKKSIAVSTPFHGGVLVARIELSSFDTLVSDRTGLGKTGESLLAYRDDNGEALFFTERRFGGEINSQSVLPMDEALDGDEKIVLGSRDYRDEEVIAVTRYIEEINVGLVTKMDEAEALGIARNELIRQALINIAIMIIFVSIVGILVAKLVTKPIKRLTSDVNEITKGKLDIQLGKSKISEIRGLSDSLNRILASLKLAILKTGSKGSELGLGEAIEAKEKAEERYKTLYETSSDAIMTLEPPTWNFTAGNPATVKMFRAKDEAEFISKTPGDLSPIRQPDKQLSEIKAKAMIEKAMKEGKHSFDWTHKRITGEEFPAHILLTKMKLKGKDVLQATVRKVTHEVEAEERLAKSERKLREAQEIAKIGHFNLNPKTQVVTGSKELFNIFGVHEDQNLYKSFVNSVHKEDKKHVTSTIKKTIENGSQYNITHRLLLKGGILKWVNAIGKAITDEAGETVSLVGTVQDITSQIREKNGAQPSSKVVAKVSKPIVKKTLSLRAKNKMGSFERKLQERADEINKKRINRTLGKK